SQSDSFATSSSASTAASRGPAGMSPNPATRSSTHSPPTSRAGSVLVLAPVTPPSYQPPPTKVRTKTAYQQKNLGRPCPRSTVDRAESGHAGTPHGGRKQGG